MADVFLMADVKGRGNILIPVHIIIIEPTACGA
jgi:hypothetical protein